MHDDRFDWGTLFETEFEKQAHARGYHVVRHCDQIGVNSVKAPLLTGPYAGYRLPDFTVLADGASYWIEAKFKSRQAFWGKTGTKRHGIDLPNWQDYLVICKLSGQAGFLLIGEQSTGALLIQSFKKLEPIAQIHTGAFSHGGVFWDVRDFVPWGDFDLHKGQMRFAFGKTAA
jgi:hypothetical protein